MPAQRLVRLVIAIILVAGAGFLGYYYGYQKGYTTPNRIASKGNLITNQVVHLNGDIIQKDDNSLTIKSSDGQTASFKYAPNIRIATTQNVPKSISPADKSGSISAALEPSHDKNDIKLGPASVELQYFNNDYFITQIALIKNKQ